MATTEETAFSKKLYDYLCDIIGWERTVHARRIFFKAFDDVFSHRAVTTMISSGSKAEGLDMKGSDIDIMTIDHSPVFHNKSEVNDTTGFITNFEISPPGFVLLHPLCENDSLLTTCTEYGPVLSSKKYKDFLKALRYGLPVNEQIFDIHGPCIVEKCVDVDHALCLRSEAWPTIAQRWFERPKNSNWPSSYVLSKMADAGLLYVPIGSKFGSNESNPLEWRISFSVQEKLLIYSFNHTQLLCYAMLKIFLKEIIETTPETKQLLCSYFMKTVVFWISEECSITKWRPECLFSCFQSCLERLIYWVQLGYCPNYFIPEHNMFEGKIYGKNQIVLLRRLETLLSLGTKIILQSVTLAKLNEKRVRCLYPNEDIDRAIYPLLHMFFKFSPTEIPPRRYLPVLVSLIIKSSERGIFKQFCFRWLVHFSLQRLIETPIIRSCSNKLFYEQYKTCRFYCLMAKNIDVVTGWLWLCLFFYQNGDFQKALSITNDILDECTPDKILITDFDSLTFERGLDAPAKLSFLQRHKLLGIYLLYKNPRLHSVFYNSDLSLSKNEIIAPPVVFVHFLRAMCNHRLGKLFERNRCLEDMESTIEEDFLIGKPVLRSSAYTNLLRAFKLTNNIDRIDEIDNKSFSELIQEPNFPLIFINMFGQRVT